MTRLSTIVVLLIGLALSPETSSFTRFTTRTTSTNLFLASRMPQFSPEEQAQLDAIMNGEYWDDSAVDYSDNLPKKRQPPPPQPTSPPPPSQQQQRPTTTVASSGSTATSNSVKKVVAPNADWRSAASKPAAELKIERSKPPVNRSKGPVDIDILDLDYDDFEAAMMEEEGGGFGDMGSKSTYAPEVHDGLMAGDVVPAVLWEKLVDAEGNPFKYARVHKDQCDVVVVYADPRRMTDEFKVILSQFNKLPLASLKVGTAAVNCDDTNDHRKYVKKNVLTCTLLNDPSKKFMDGVKARLPGRLAACLLILDVRTDKVLKVWYENDWDAFSTKDLLSDEIKSYRKNPVAYVQMQIGIR